MDKFEKILNKLLGPFATFMSNSLFFTALSESFMRITPITLGTSFLMIIGDFPVSGWKDYLVIHNIYPLFQAVIGATIGAMSIYLAFNFSYIYAKKSGYNALSGGLISLTSFFIVMPQTVGKGEQVTEAFQTIYTGGTGLFSAIIVAYISSRLYVYLNKKNLVIKMPDTVPSNVSESLAPSFISLIIFSLFFLISLALHFTPFDNLFMVVFGILQKPLQVFTGNFISIICLSMLANLVWFFGIHPNVIYGLVLPMILANIASNVAASSNGEPMPYAMMSILLTAAMTGFGGQGGTYGWIISSFSAKSERYKQIRKLAAIPSIFNINEPLIFGAPIMLNPVYFVPMVFGPIFMGFTAWGAANILQVSFNPKITMPWTTPSLVATFVQGGFTFALVAFFVLLVDIAVWYPFFKVADSKIYKEEQQALKNL